MKKLPKLLAIAVLVSASLISCKKKSSKIDQNKIHQRYSLSFNENTDQTTLKAEFSVDNADGKDVELTGGSSVTVNESALSYSSGVYTKTFAGKISSAKFVYTNADGKSYTNTVTLCSSIGNDSRTYIFRSSSYYWYFDGKQIGANEKVYVKAVSKEDENKTTSFTGSTVQATSVAMSSSSLSVLPYGNATFTTSREHSTSSGEFTNAGGACTSTFVGLSDLVTVYY